MVLTDVAYLRDPKPLWGIGEVLMLSLPAGMSMLARTLMRFVDGYMVSNLGPDPLTAQFVAGMTAFVFEAFILGTLTAVNTYVSQNFGAGRNERCGQYARAGLLLSVSMAACCLPLLLPARAIFVLLGQDASLVGMQAMYFRYMILSIMIGQPAVTLSRFFYGVHRPGIVFISAILANGFNVFANWVLIFGKLGFPAMGLEGAAIGTLISTGLQLAVMVCFFLGPRMNARYATRRLQVSIAQCRHILAVGWPAGVQFSNNLISWSMMTTVLVSRFGKDHQAAQAIVIRYTSLSFMPAVGIGIAATTLVGRYIGAGRKDLARRRTHAAVLLAMAYMGVCGLAFLIFRRPLVNWFVTISPDGVSGAEAAAQAAKLVTIGGKIMICVALFQLFDAAGIGYIGALRGAGDTRWPMALTMCLSWTMIVGGGILAVNFAPALESVGPWIAASVYIIILGLLLARRFESGAWEKISLAGHTPTSVECRGDLTAEDAEVAETGETLFSKEVTDDSTDSMK